MSKIRFVPKNYLVNNITGDMTVTAGSGVLNQLLPAGGSDIKDALTSSYNSRQYRGTIDLTGPGTYIFEFQLDQPMALNLTMSMFFHRHNITVGTYRVELISSTAAGASTGTTEFDSGNVTIDTNNAPINCEVNMNQWGFFTWGSPWGTATASGAFFGDNALWFTTPSTLTGPSADKLDRVKITFTAVGTSESNDHFEISRIILGQYFQPSINFSKGFNLGVNETGSFLRTDGGALISEFSNFFRTLDLTFSVIPESERRSFHQMFMHCGLRRDLLVSAYPGDSNSIKEQDFTMLAKFVRPFNFVNLQEDYYSLRMSIAEVTT